MLNLHLLNRGPERQRRVDAPEPELYLLHPRNAELASRKEPLPVTPLWIYLLVFLGLLDVCLTGPVVLFGDVPLRLALAVCAALNGIVAVAVVRMWRRERRGGGSRVIEGRLLDWSTVTGPGASSHVELAYEFRTPEGEPEIRRQRLLKWQALVRELPRPGARVAVLYGGDGSSSLL